MQVGDLVRLSNNEDIPADMVLLVLHIVCKPAEICVPACRFVTCATTP
jgi:hypothetical protein